MAEKSLDDLAVEVYDVSISGSDAGYIDEPEVTLEADRSEIRLTQLHKQLLGTRIRGVKGRLRMRFRQIKAANLARAFPWFDGTPGTDPIPIAPATLGEDLYQYAVPIVLHPIRLDAEDTSHDYTFPKAVPSGSHRRSGSGDEDDYIEIEWDILPDRADLPDVVLGWIGSDPG